MARNDKEEIKQLKDRLFTAVKEGKLEETKECIKDSEGKDFLGSIINAKDSAGYTPLWRAVISENIEMAKLLIDNGASVNSRDNDKDSPLHYSAVHGTPEMLELLASSRGANFNGKFGDGYENLSILCWMIKGNKPEKVKILLEHGANPNEKLSYYKDADGKDTPLHIAALEGYAEVAALLIKGGKGKKGADVNALDAMNETPIYKAIRSENPQMIKLLLEKGAKIDIKNKSGQTPSDVAGYIYPGKTISEIAEESKSIKTEDSIGSTHVASSAEKPTSFASNVINWIGASTAALFQHAPALSSAEQPPVASSSASAPQVNFNGGVQLVDVAIRTFTGVKHEKPLDDSLLTVEQIQERKLNSVEAMLTSAKNKFEKLDQCPRSSLDNTTISKGKSDQKSF